jgi:hypothetical protein
MFMTLTGGTGEEKFQQEQLLKIYQMIGAARAVEQAGNYLNLWLGQGVLWLNRAETF